MNTVLHRSPSDYGVERSRWRLLDLGRALAWLEGCSEGGISQLLKRLNFRRKQFLSFVHSPDPLYEAKCQRIQQAYQEAWQHPGRVVLLYQDELSYYRRSALRAVWQAQGPRQRPYHLQIGSNTLTRITATLDGCTGQVVYRQRSKVGRVELAAFYRQVRQAYPDAAVIYLVQDNWSVHTHPEVQQALAEVGITQLLLPTYSSWRNPIEKLWRWLRQDLLHSYDEQLALDGLRQRVLTWLNAFTGPSDALLRYVGLPLENSSAPIPILNC